MPATKIKGLGTLLQVKIATVFTTIGQRVEIDGPDTSMGVQVTTDLDSLAVEKRATLADNGDVSLKIWFDPGDTTHTQLVAWSQTPPTPNPQWQISFATTPVKVAGFEGIVAGFKVGGMTPDGYLTGDLKISISGLVTWGAGP